MKPNIFFLSLYIIFNSHSVYSQTFSEEPIIRVRIIFTLDSLSIVFNEKWLANDRNNFNPINFSTDDYVFFRIDDDHIIINNLSNNSTSSFDMVGLKV